MELRGNQQPGQRWEWPTSLGFPLAAEDWLSSLSDGPAIKSSYRGIETNNLPVNRSSVIPRALICKRRQQPSSRALTLLTGYFQYL